MKNLFLIGMALAAVVAQADIKRPPRPSYTVEVLEGQKAKAMYESMNVPVQPGDSLRTYNSVYKVERLNGGLVQNICKKGVRSYPQKSTEFSCEIWSSSNGQPVPAYRVPRRLG